MNNFKVMMHGYGTGHHVRADLLERGDLTD